MHPYLIVLEVICAIFSVSSAAAQVTIDATKITCDQYVHSKIASPRIIAAWLSGYYNGKSGNQVVDLKSFEANLRKLERFCYQEKNFNIPVMQAVEKAIGEGKR
jgi:acid stress chaperone HdeB